MVKVPRRGVSYQCLDERESTLQQIVAELGLKPLSKRANRELRARLGLALGKWEQPKAGLTVRELIGSLNLLAESIEKLTSVGAVAKGGWCHAEDVELAGLLAQSLAEEPTGPEAWDYLADFGERTGVIAKACRAAVARLQLIKGKGGGTPYASYDEFTAVLLELCKRNKIEPKARIDRASGEPVGGLANLAVSFEKLLPARMRSSTPSAMVKRLKRSIDRLNERFSRESVAPADPQS